MGRIYKGPVDEPPHPNLDIWINRKFGYVNFRMTQLLSSHWCFKGYLHRFRHEDNPYCLCCYPAVEETNEHILVECRRFSGIRSELEYIVGARVSRESFVSFLL